MVIGVSLFRKHAISQGQKHKEFKGTSAQYPPVSPSLLSLPSEETTIDRLHLYIFNSILHNVTCSD